MPDLTRLVRAPLQSADEAGDAVRRVIRAYHGSPHSFDRFDASKIGTGEGAQSYGHGLYFAGNEAVARSYRDALERIAMPQTPEEMASDYLRTWHRPDAARQMAETHLQDAASYRIPGERQALIRAAIDLMDSGQAKVLGPRGRMYEVEIDYPEEALLDYDRPFATPGGIRGAAVLRQENPDILTEPMLRALRDGSWRFESYAGWQNAAEALARLPKTQSGAQALMEAGVPGIRYLDQGSRSAGEGTRNYVMFPGTEDRIRILRKYGLLAPMGAGMMGGEE